MSNILFRSQVPTPLTFAQMDDNLRFLYNRVRTPFYLNIPGSASDPLLSKSSYSNVWGNPSALGTYSISSANNSTLRMWPFIVQTTVVVSTWMSWVVSLNTTSVIEFGLYDSDDYGFPTNRITGGMGASLYYVGQTFAGMPATLLAGKVYWLAVNQAGSSGSLRGVAPPLGMIHWKMNNSGESQAMGLKFPSTPYGAMPASVVFVDWDTNADSAAIMPAFILE